MPELEHSIIPKEKLICLKGTGPLTFHDLAAKIIEINKDPLFRTDYDTFVELQDAVVPFEPDELRQFEEFLRILDAREPARKWAIYTLNAHTMRSMNLIRNLLSKNIEVSVSSNRIWLLKWLGKSDFDS